ncbi:MAG: HEAT repeat domain-containing protein, partial [Roseimicrobium sp.]
LSENVAFRKMDGKTLISQLGSARRWDRLFAKQEMKSRDAAEMLKALDAAKETAGEEVAADKDEGPINNGKPIKTGATDAKENPAVMELPPSRINQPVFSTRKVVPRLELAWAKETLNSFDATLCTKLAASPDHHIRAAALRILSQHLTETPDAMKLLEKAIADEHPQVRLWAIACLNLLSKPEALPVALRALDKPMDNNLDFLLELMCREQADAWLPVFLKGKLKLDANPKHLVYALKSTGKPEALQPLLDSLASGKLADDDVPAVLAMVGDAANPQQLERILALASSAGGGTRTILSLDALNKAAQRGAFPANLTVAQATALLDARDQGIAIRAALLVGLWKQEPLRERLVSWVTEASTAAPLRSAAVRGLVSLGGETSKSFLVTLCTQNGDASTRALALAGLTDLAPNLAA